MHGPKLRTHFSAGGYLTFWGFTAIHNQRTTRRRRLRANCRSRYQMAEHVVSAPLQENEALSSEELQLTSGRQIQQEEDAGGLCVSAGIICTSAFRSRAPRRGGMSMRLALRPPLQRIGIYEAPPALSVEERPMAFRLSEPVGDGVKRCRMRPEAEVARIDHNVFGEVAPGFHAAAPRHNAVGRAPDRGRRHRWSRPH